MRGYPAGNGGYVCAGTSVCVRRFVDVFAAAVPLKSESIFRERINLVALIHAR